MTQHDQPYDTPPTEPGELEDALLADPPSWPKVVGIISIVWASLGLTCTGLGVLGLLFMPMMAGAAQGQSLPPTMQPGILMWVNLAVGFVVVLLLMAAGISLVNRRPSGRSLHLVYGVTGILTSSYGLFVQWQGIQQMAQWRQANPTSPFAQGGSPTADLIGLLFGAVLGLAWPIFCLIWFGLIKRTHDSITGGLDEPAA
jgi:hypothetical protein